MSNISIVSTSNGQYGISSGDSPLLRVAPEPQSSIGSWMGRVAAKSLDYASTLLPGGAMLGSSDLTDLLTTQFQLQQQMQLVSMISNIQHAEHEMEKAPIRNMRIG